MMIHFVSSLLVPLSFISMTRSKIGDSGCKWNILRVVAVRNNRLQGMQDADNQ